MKKFIVVIILLLIGGCYYAFSSVSTLVYLAELSGSNQSSFYNFCLERIYANIDCDDGYSEVLTGSELYSDHFTWLRVLSVTGDPGASEFIYQELKESFVNDKKGRLLPFYIKSAGILGLHQAKDLLFEIAKEENRLEKALAVSALYYLDGENYGKRFDDEYIVSDKMKMVRAMIVNSAGRCRNYEEMIAIDASYRTNTNN